MRHRRVHAVGRRHVDYRTESEPRSRRERPHENVRRARGRRRRRLRGRSGRGLRLSRTERRGQVDHHQDAVHPGRADLWRGDGGRLRHRPPARRGTAQHRAGLPGPDARPVPDRGAEPAHARGALRRTPVGAAGPDDARARDGRAGGSQARAGGDILRWHEAPAGDRPRPAARATGAVPRRAHGGSRPADEVVDLALHQRPAPTRGHHHLHDHALHGRGGVLRPDRHHGPRPDRGDGHAGGAEGRHRQGPGPDHHRGRRGCARGAPVDVRTERADRRGAADLRGARWRVLRAPLVRRARSAHQVRQRVEAVAGRRVHVLHRHHDPRRGGGGRSQSVHACNGQPGAVTMSTTIEPAAPTLAAVMRSAPASLGFRHDLRGVRVVWQREMIRFSRDRLRIVTSLIQPVLFLFVLGTGLSTITNGSSSQSVNLRTFMYPGALSMAVLFTAMFSAASIVWDREFGFLREMLVAPVSRWSIVLGKTFGGATNATLQGVIILAMAGIVGVPYSLTLFLTVFGELLLLAVTLTAFGVMMAARINQIQSFMALQQMLLMPLFFLSGALFPLSNLPAWLQFMTRIDPLTYAVDPVRRAIFAHLQAPAGVVHRLNPGVTWGGWRVPTSIEVLIVAAMGTAFLAVAIWQFQKAE